MKLVVAIVQPDDANRCSDALTAAGFLCTRFESSGGFLDGKNVTLVIGVDDPLVDSVLDVLRKSSRERTQSAAPVATPDPSGQGVAAMRMDVEVGGATVFVVDVDRFERL